MRATAVIRFGPGVLSLGLLISSVAFHATSQPDAKMIYAKNCVMCHGAEGKGFPAIKTPDFTDPKWQSSVTDKDIFTSVKEGKKDTAMKPFADKLSDEEIRALVTYVRSLNSAKKK